MTDGRRPALALLTVSIGLFMLLLDLTIVYIALPQMKVALHAGLTELQWVIDAYALTLAATLLVCGSVADVVGRRRVFVAGLAVFALASLGCGLARSATPLIAGRAVQGLGAAMMFSTSLAIVDAAFEGQARARAFGVLGAVTAAAGGLGPIVGGSLTEAFGWQTIFLVNVPVGAGALVLATRVVGESRRADPPPVDWAGAILLGALLTTLVLALLRGNEAGWRSTPILALLGATAAGLAAFVLVERRRRDPLLDPALFRRPAFLGASLVAFAQSASLFALLLYVVLYLQGVLGYAPLAAGLCLLPISLAALAPGLAAGWLATRVPVRALLGGGLALIAVGLLLMTRSGTDTTWPDLVPAFLLGGLGLGLLQPPLAAAAVDVVAAGRAGFGSGVNATFRQIGIAIGVAGYGAIFQHRISARVLEALHGTRLASYSERISAAIVAGGQGETLAAAPPLLRPRLHGLATEAFVGGLHVVLVVAALVAGAGALAAVVLMRGYGLGALPGVTTAVLSRGSPR